MLTSTSLLEPCWQTVRPLRNMHWVVSYLLLGRLRSTPLQRRQSSHSLSVHALIKVLKALGGRCAQGWLMLLLVTAQWPKLPALASMLNRQARFGFQGQ